MTEPQSSHAEAPGAQGSPDTLTPPTSISGIMRQIGPGLITAGAVVGSGELIATTKTGAQAGFWLLWLIIIGCLIKVFVQIEFGRYAISSGKTTILALDEVPGPRLRVNWLLWYWLVMFIASLAQLGGIIHGVGQAMALNLPLDGSYNRLLAEQDRWNAEAAKLPGEPMQQTAGANARQIQGRTDAEIQRQLGPKPDWRSAGFFWTDDISWATLLTLLTIAILVTGRYALIQNLSALMVAGFTAVTVFCVLALQVRPDWALHWSDLRDGLSFRLPPAISGGTSWTPLATALATFGIIGVGTSELISYPYWCLEKGYARYAGPRQPGADWVGRALGWLRVMRWDALVAMIIYTFATVAFYLLGAAVLHRKGLDPTDTELIRILCYMYVPVFGPWAMWLFLFGAFSVLYSTFFAASAGHTRVSADATRLFGLGARTEPKRQWWIRAYCVIIPLFALAACIVIRQPVGLVLTSGVLQSIMLPMLAGAALYFRYRRCDQRIVPRGLWDVMLWLSAVGLLVSGCSTAATQLAKLWR